MNAQNQLITAESSKGLAAVLRAVAGYDNETATALALNELENLQSMAVSNPDILKCEAISVMAAVRSTIRMGLSLDPNLKLVYVTTRNFKQGDGWGKRLEITPSVNGLIYMAQDQGILQDFERPEIELDEKGAVRSVTWRYQTNSQWKDVTKDRSYFDRLAGFSAKQNKGTANALYTSEKGGPDPEFAATKVMRHVLSKMGLNPMRKIKMASQDFEPVVELIEENDNTLDL